MIATPPTPGWRPLASGGELHDPPPSGSDLAAALLRARTQSNSRQLDILAFEPFYGGARRSMLDAISRCSRHRWNLMKLPPRKMERRLLVSATWFAEHISRNDPGKVHLIFTSEALNLADLFRLVPALASVPAVVYFHDTQLPGPDARRLDTPTDLVNLNSAMAASEIWFNSLYNLRTFLSRASAMVSRHRELQMRSPLLELTAKAQLVPPPVDLTLLHELAAQSDVQRDPRSILVDARGADQKIVGTVLRNLEKRTERLRISIIGKVKGIPESKVTFLAERDDAGHLRSLLESGVLVTARPGAPADDLIVRALATRCHPVVPNSGVYPELLPEAMHPHCLHDGSADSMIERILDGWRLDYPVVGYAEDLEPILEPFDAIKACRNIDDRLAKLAEATPARV